MHATDTIVADYRRGDDWRRAGDERSPAGTAGRSLRPRRRGSSIRDARIGAASSMTAVETVSHCACVQLGEHRQRQHFVRRALGVRKCAGRVAEVRERREQMHRDRIVDAGLDALRVQRVLPDDSACGGADRVDVIDVARIEPSLRASERRCRPADGRIARPPSAAPPSTLRDGATSRAGSRPGCLPCGSCSPSARGDTSSRRPSRAACGSCARTRRCSVTTMPPSP